MADFNFQIHRGDRPDEAGMVKLEGSPSGLNKPHGGLWTSTYTPGDHYQSDWDRWCRDNNFGDLHPTKWKLAVSPKANVLHLEDVDDFRRIYAQYGVPGRESWQNESTIRLNWNAIAGDFDGFHLGHDAVRDYRYSTPTVLGIRTEDFSSWDAESTVWFKWVFDDVQEVETTRFVDWGWGTGNGDTRRQIVEAIQGVPGAAEALIAAYPEFGWKDAE